MKFSKANTLKLLYLLHHSNSDYKQIALLQFNELGPCHNIHFLIKNHTTKSTRPLGVKGLNRFESFDQSQVRISSLLHNELAWPIVICHPFHGHFSNMSWPLL
jgi:hypothetical protein